MGARPGWAQAVLVSTLITDALNPILPGGYIIAHICIILDQALYICCLSSQGCSSTLSMVFSSQIDDISLIDLMVNIRLTRQSAASPVRVEHHVVGGRCEIARLIWMSRSSSLRYSRSSPVAPVLTRPTGGVALGRQLLPVAVSLLLGLCWPS